MAVKHLTFPHFPGFGEAARPFRLSIRFKITFPYLLLALVLALGATYLVYRIVFDNVDERFTNQMIEAGKLSSEWMVREEDRLLGTLRQVSYTEGVSAAVRAQDAEQLRNLVFGIVVNNQEEVVEFLDLHGNPILSMHHRQGGNLEEYSYSQGGDQPSPTWPFVTKVIQNQSDAIGDKFSGFVRDETGGTFYVSGPIYDGEDTRIGILLIGKRLSTLAAEMRSSTLAHISLYDLRGQPLISTLFNPQPMPQSMVAKILLKKNQSSLKRDLGNTRDLTSADIDYGEISSAWQTRGGDELGLLGVALPKNFWVSMSLPTRNQMLILVGISFLFIILLGLNLANLITKPLFGLVHASEEVAKGNLSIQVPPTTQDEIGYLTETFNQMVSSLQKSKEDLLEAYDSTLEGWSKALELRDEETGGHTERVTRMTVALAKRMGITGENLINIRRGALLHDNGKIGIPDAILRKTGKLNDDEWMVMRKHPQLAVEMLWPIDYLRPALEIPGCHHEKWDGSGYPKGLKGEEIPLAARIFAITDVWDALTSDRVYRPAMPVMNAMRIIWSGRGVHFDPQIVDCFFEYFDEITSSAGFVVIGPKNEHCPVS